MTSRGLTTHLRRVPHASMNVSKSFLKTLGIKNIHDKGFSLNRFLNEGFVQKKGRRRKY